MNKNMKWSLYQIFTFFIFISCLLLLHKWIVQVGIRPGILTPISAILFLVITWVYTTIYFQQQKYPRLLEHKIWCLMPLIITIMSVLSLVGFIILGTMGPLLDWMAEGNWIIYAILVYAITLYYFFVMSLVYKLSDSQSQVIHQTYAWALGLLLVILFVF